MELTITQKIEIEIHNHIGNTGKDANVVLIHPKDYVSIFAELRSSGLHWDDSPKPFNYRGIKVVRSFDIKEGKIEVY